MLEDKIPDIVAQAGYVSYVAGDVRVVGCHFREAGGLVGSDMCLDDGKSLEGNAWSVQDWEDEGSTLEGNLEMRGPKLGAP